MGKIKSAFKKDPVLYISFLLAAVSAFFAPFGKEYIDYIDWRVLGLLLSLMLVVAGLKSVGLFDLVTTALLRKVRSSRALAAVLVGICFVSSMLITNDVALITFVPLGVMLLSEAKREDLMIPVIVLQTVAANLGSGLTPLGNPQNLYLYSLSGMGAGEFLGVMALPTVGAFILLALSLLLIKKGPASGGNRETEPLDAKMCIVWCLMFALCLLAVLRILHFAIALGVVLLAALIFNRKLLKSADYALLFTFIFLFIFIGNIKSIPAVSNALRGIVGGRELTVGILLSQVISNVPAAMLLSGFTENYKSLLLGVNLGGLGTLIASMASMISYKLYAKTENARSGRYLGVFTLANAAFLVILWGLVLLIN